MAHMRDRVLISSAPPCVLPDTFSSPEITHLKCLGAPALVVCILLKQVPHLWRRHVRSVAANRCRN